MKTLTDKITQVKKRCTSYDSLSNATRQALAKLVLELNVSVRQASKDLGIKYSTGKALIQRCKKIGKFERKRG